MPTSANSEPLPFLSVFQALAQLARGNRDAPAADRSRAVAGTSGFRPWRLFRASRIAYVAELPLPSHEALRPFAGGALAAPAAHLRSPAGRRRLRRNRSTIFNKSGMDFCVALSNPVRGKAQNSVMRNLSDREKKKILITYFYILENKNHRIFKNRDSIADQRSPRCIWMPHGAANS